MAEAVSDVSFEGDDLLQAAKERNLNVLTTGLFTKMGPGKGISNPNKFASAAFNLPVMEISDIQDFEDGYYILQVIEKIPEKISEFEMVNKEVRADLVKERQDAKAVKDADAFLSALRSGKSMSTESKNYNLTPTTTGLYKRNDSIPNIGSEREISEVAFKLTNENKLPEKVIKGKKGYYVIQFRERKMPELEEFSKEKDAITETLLQQKKSTTFAALLSQIKDKSEITIKEGFFD
jgi:peptidyl-prolyl cis-trans isomerase D